LAVAAAPERRACLPVERRARVLVIDDEPAFGEMVREALAERGVEAIWVASPGAALEQVGRGAYEAAVVDLVLPGMDGLELSDRIRDASPDTQTVILTGRGDMASAIEGIRHGVFEYLQKGESDLGRLWRAVDGAIERSRLVQQNRELIDAQEDSKRLLHSLHASASRLMAEPFVDRLLDLVVGAVRETCDGRSARVVLLDASRAEERLVSMAAGAGTEVLGGIRLRHGEGLMGAALDTGETIVVPNARADPRYSARSDEMPGIESGYMCAPLRHRSVLGVVAVAESPRGAFTSAQREALEVLARQAAVSIESAVQQERAVNSFTRAADILVDVLESIDVSMKNHSRGVAALADMMTRRLNLPDSERRSIHFGALLHDIGKAKLDISVIRGEDLSDEAWVQIRKHPEIGYEMLRPIALWEGTLAIVYSHHERWDGRGFPRGLAGEEIPLGARIVAIADAYDAMVRPEPLPRKRHPGGPAAELQAAAGSQFDPELVRVFLEDIATLGDPRLGGS
jgi:putative nucleotidyltransferase with HDIG domain